MSNSRKKPVWNRRKEETSKNHDESSKDEFMYGDSGEFNELVTRVQHRLGVSRDKAKNIIRNSELI